MIRTTRSCLETVKFLLLGMWSRPSSFHRANNHLDAKLACDFLFRDSISNEFIRFFKTFSDSSSVHACMPSKSTSESRIPFWDASGRKLIDEWYKIPRDVFLNPKLFYITGVAHCYSPNKKVAARLRRECSKKWLEQELSFLDPCLYIIIGKPAADFFFPNKKYIAELVFQNHVWKNKTAFVLPHPSGLNNGWLKDNPKFQSDRLNDIRKAVHEAIREFLEKH